MNIGISDIPLPPGVAARVVPLSGLRADLHVDGWNQSLHAAPITIKIDVPLAMANGMADDLLRACGMPPASGRGLGRNVDELTETDRQLLARLLPAGLGEVALTARVRLELDAVLGVQRRIAAAARRAGIDAPLPWPVARPADLRIGHLKMARGFAAALVARHGDRATKIIQLRLFDALAAHGNEAVVDHLTHGPGDGTDTIGWCDEDGARLKFGLEIGGRAELAGNALTVHDAHLPATILVSAHGRAMGEIVATGVADLDALRIESVADDGRMTKFILEDEWILLREHHKIGDTDGQVSMPSGRIASKRRLARLFDPRS